MKTDKEKILEMMQSLDEMKQRMDPILKNIERLCDNIERLTKVPAFKDGDFITNDFHTAIFKEYAKDGKLVAYCLEGSLCGFVGNGSLSAHHLPNANYRLANAGQINEFYATMHKNGKNWDAVNKKVIDYKWMPEAEETYYFPSLRNECGFVMDSFLGRSFDLRLLERDLVCRTPDEATAKLFKMLDAIK